MRRNIQKHDINWKDQELVCRFLNNSGQILNRYQSRLPNRVQRKLKRVVMRLRNLSLLPVIGVLKPTDKINI